MASAPFGADYMHETTTPGKGEKLSDQKLMGKVALLLLELCAKVRFITSPSSFLKETFTDTDTFVVRLGPGDRFCHHARTAVPCSRY